MPFDANLVLADNTADWTYANMVTNEYGAPVLTTKNDGGFVVIDLKALSTTPSDGLAAIFLSDEAGAAATDALTLILQGSNELDFVADATNPVRTIATFDVGGVTPGVILGNECPCTVVRRFSTRLRYIRAYATCVADDDFHTCWVLLAHYPFHTL